MNNPWELYESMTGWQNASAALQVGWNHAKNLPTEAEARAYMLQLMRRYADFGAYDSEGFHHLDYLIENKKTTW